MKRLVIMSVVMSASFTNLITVSLENNVAFAKPTLKKCPTLLQSSNIFSKKSVNELEKKMRDYGYFGPTANAFKVGNYGVAIWLREGKTRDVAIIFNRSQKTISHYQVLDERKSDKDLVNIFRYHGASAYEVTCLLNLRIAGGSDGSW